MEEPPLSESPIGVRYYGAMMDSRKHIGRPEFFNAAAHVLACPGRSSDHIYIFLHVKDEVILEARWLCHMCDPWMQIAGDIVCRLLEGRRTGSVLELRLADFEEVLEGSDYVIAQHTGAAALVAYKGVLDYEVKQVLRDDLPEKFSPKDQLHDLGFSGREGMLRIKRLMEGHFQAEGLKIPRTRLESACANGTVQDFSVLVQDLLEARAIELVKSNGLGFPLSFDEALEGNGDVDR